jgi:hypothetical protein
VTRRWPPQREIRWDDTHRLIPDAYAVTYTPVLAALVDEQHLDDVDALMDLARATSRRLLVQEGHVPSGIHVDELVFGVPEWQIVNAAFCYPHPQGARFNGPARGAWYAGRDVETSLAEVAFHRTVELAETDYWDLSLEYQDFLADIHGTFHDLRGLGDRRTTSCLAPNSYVHSQALAEELLKEGSLGVVYPSVRRQGGEVVACFRPAAVGHVRRGGRFRLSWDAPGPPVSTHLAPS